MAAYDGSIRIQAVLNYDNFSRGIAAMTASVNRLRGTITSIGAAVGIAFGVGAIVNFGRESVRVASESSNAWLGLQSIVEGQGRSFSRAKSFLQDYVADGLIPLTDAVTAYKNLAARGYTDEQIEQTLIALKDSAAFGRQSSYTLGQAVKTATEGLKNENSILVDNAGVTKNVAQMWKEYAQSIGVSTQSLTKEQKIQAEVNGILEETKFQTGDAAKLTGEYSGQVSLLSTNFTNFKVALGEALIPIAEAVLPGLNAIVAALTRVATAFGQVTALLFGKSATANKTTAKSAVAAADATNGLADATSNAGSAAKKTAKDMKGVLAGFDELNILADNTASSLSGAAGGLAGAGADLGGIDIPEFEADTSTFEDAVKKYDSLGEMFNAFLDDTLAGMPKLNEAFEGFAERLNKMNKTLYEGFTFPGVKEKVGQVGAELAKAFNGLVEKIDWKLIGKTFSAGLNLALSFLNNAIYTFDWVSLGKSFAEWINGIAEETDWEELGRTIWGGFKIAIDFFVGYITTVDPEELSLAGRKIIYGFFNGMMDTVKNTNWAEVFVSIINYLMYSLPTHMVLGIGADIGKALAEGLKNGIVDIISGISDWIKSNFVDPIVNAVKKFFGIHSPSTVFAEIGRNLIAGLLKGITDTWSTITAFFSQKLSELKQTVSAAWSGIMAIFTPAAEWFNANVITPVSAAFTTLWTAVSSSTATAWQNITKTFSKASGWFDSTVAKPITKTFKGMFNGLISYAEGFANYFIRGVNGIISALNKLRINIPKNPITGAINIGVNIPKASSVKLPRLANGAVIPPNQQFAAILGDQRSGTNIEAPLATIRQAVMEAMEAVGAGGAINITVESKLDGKVVARNTVQHINSMTRAAGKPVLLL